MSIRLAVGRRGPPRACLLLSMLLVVELLCAIAPGASAGVPTTARTTTPSLTRSFPLGHSRLRNAPGRQSSTRTVITPSAPRGGVSHRPLALGSQQLYTRPAPPLLLVVALIGGAVVVGLVVPHAWPLPGVRSSATRQVAAWPELRRTRRKRIRHPVPILLIWLLRPLFRYSAGRRAYVLRLVGRRFGPVLVTREEARMARPTKANDE